MSVQERCMVCYINITIGLTCCRIVLVSLVLVSIVRKKEEFCCSCH